MLLVKFDSLYEIIRKTFGVRDSRFALRNKYLSQSSSEIANLFEF